MKKGRRREKCTRCREDISTNVLNNLLHVSAFLPLSRSSNSRQIIAQATSLRRPVINSKPSFERYLSASFEFVCPRDQVIAICILFVPSSSCFSFSFSLSVRIFIAESLHGKCTAFFFFSILLTLCLRRIDRNYLRYIISASCYTISPLFYPNESFEFVSLLYISTLRNVNAEERLRDKNCNLVSETEIQSEYVTRT